MKNMKKNCNKPIKAANSECLEKRKAIQGTSNAIRLMNCFVQNKKLI